MDYYYGWGFFLWPLLFFFLIFGVFAWGPFRWRGRGSPYGAPRYDQEYWSYPPYSPEYLRHRDLFRGRGPKGYRRSDARILEDVNDRLLVHGEVDATGIEVRVQNGHLTLTGTVANRAQKRMAEWIADSVPGVEDVSNELVIRKGFAAGEAA